MKVIHFHPMVTTTLIRPVAVEAIYGVPFLKFLSSRKAHRSSTTTILNTKINIPTPAPLHRASRNVLERRWASNLLVVNIPAIEITLGPIPPPVATRLEVLRELSAPGATLNTANSLSPIVESLVSQSQRREKGGRRTKTCHTAAGTHHTRARRRRRACR